MNEEQKQKIENKALESVVQSCNLYKIDFFSLPKELKDAIREVYISGCRDTIDYTEGK